MNKENENARIHISLSKSFLDNLDSEIKRNPLISTRSKYIREAVQYYIKHVHAKDTVEYVAWIEDLNYERLWEEYEKEFAKTHDTTKYPNTHPESLVWKVCLKRAVANLKAQRSE